MPAKKLPTMAPCEARTFEEVCRLETDHHTVKSGWIMNNGGRVALVNQCNGQASTGTVEFSFREFDALVAWWQRQQKLSAR